jgi:phosphopantothenoylcysteine decarboxylase/phosphopantothenate--cysteine ligase
LPKHTSKLIIGSISQALAGKTIALCVTGSVAAVECVAVARMIMRHGAEVKCVMTASAQKIVHPELLEWATGNPVVTKLTGMIEHIDLAGKHDEHVDLVLVAPSTANTIGKVANGIDDTSVTTTVSSAIGAGIPVVFVPAMHESMYDHPAVITNIETLKSMGVSIVSPRLEEAKAKFPHPEDIVKHIIAELGPKDLGGIEFLVTAGPTRGWIDRVRFVTNPSSGKMGLAIVEELLRRGAKVHLVLGPVALQPPSRANTTHVNTSEEMLEVVLKTISEKEITSFISVAAVLDFVPEKQEERKIESGDTLTVTLKPSVKIINKAREQQKELFIVGFKVEAGVTDSEMEAIAREKIESGVCDLVVANDSERKGVAFGTDTNEVLLVGPKKFTRKIPLASKQEIARQIVDEIRVRIVKG